MKKNKKSNKFIKTTIIEFLNENKNIHNDKAINYFNNLPNVDKYSEQEDSITDESIFNLAKEISGDGKIVKKVLAKVKTYDPIISWKAYNINDNTVEYYKFKSKHNIGRGGNKYIISKKIYVFDNEYVDGVSTLAEPIKSFTTGWIDEYHNGLFIDRLHSYFKEFLHRT